MADDLIKGIPINGKGFGTISKFAMQDRRLDICAKAIYAYFNSFSGGGDTCFPSRGKICYDLGISNERFSKYLKQLTENGYIKVEQIKEYGKFSHNVYTICSTIVQPCTENPDTEKPCAENADTVKPEHGKSNTNINNNNINNNYNINNNNKKAASRFTPPTVEEVRAYCIERANSVDAERFVDYYTANGWKVGKNTMKDWKASVRTWEKNGYSNAGQNRPVINRPKTAVEIALDEMLPDCEE